MDILIQGMADRNRALDGDEVAVLVHHKALWKVRRLVVVLVYYILFESLSVIHHCMCK